MHGVLVELAQPPAGAHASPEKGFDHLAITVADYAAARETWRRVIGLEVAHELRLEARGTLIGQLPCGQCTIELIAATTPDSPLARRIAEEGPRISSMVAIEVPEIAAAIARYRAAGLTLPDAAPGALPRSVTSTISAPQAFGLAIQLIQFER
ncbi:MAG: hypothetical protein EXR65_06055 [Dehalococcoidia bacterium]|nr:hypothetical protein [Dehalococcoidia bacterium]